MALSYERLKPPSFSVGDESEQHLLLHYVSERPGLTPMMVGLLKGLAQRFHEHVDVSLEQSKAEGAAHDTFRVQWIPTS